HPGNALALPRAAPPSGAAPGRCLPGHGLGGLQRGGALRAGRRAGPGVEHRGVDPAARGRSRRRSPGKVPAGAQRHPGTGSGVALAWAILGQALEHPSTNFAATLPTAGLGAAFAAEIAISFVLMTVVVRVGGSQFARWTGVCAGALVAIYIFAEAPISGMSMNPARSLASAIGGGGFATLWIYFLGPPLGMFAA